nr:MAG TPA: hypothetical protein [Caudoviricetes sp.]
MIVMVFPPCCAYPFFSVALFVYNYIIALSCSSVKYFYKYFLVFYVCEHGSFMLYCEYGGV